MLYLTPNRVSGDSYTVLNVRAVMITEKHPKVVEKHLKETKNHSKAQKNHPNI